MAGSIAVILALLISLCDNAAASAASKTRAQGEVNSIIIHTISGPSCKNNKVVYSGAPGNVARWKKFFDNHPFLSIHYIVDREGEVASSMPETMEANHALGNNARTIGIELVHSGDGVEPFPQPMLDALVALVRSIRTRHPIPIEQIKSHAAVDVRTFKCADKMIKSRLDPGENFPWQWFRAEVDRTTGVK